MTTRTLRFGLLIGVTGGLLMAAFAMTAMAATGHGFFTIVNLIAHTFWKGAPVDGRFVAPAFILGLAIHLAISVTLGTLLAFLVERGALDGGIVFFIGLALGGSAWVVQAFAWPALDTTASAAFTPWILAVAHLVFALGAAWTLLRIEHRLDQRPTDLVGAPA